MRNKKIVLVLLMAILCVNLFFVLVAGRFINPIMSLSVKVKSDVAQKVQVAYSLEDELTEKTLMFTDFDYINIDEALKTEITVPNNIRAIRLDFGDLPNETVDLQEVSLSVLNAKYDLTDSMKNSTIVNNMEKISDETYRFTNVDPYIVLILDGNELYNFWKSTWTLRLGFGILLSCIFDVIAAVTLFLFRKNKDTKDLVSNWRTIWNLSKRDFKTKYAGSYLGIFWAFVQPIVTILLYWFVFEVGFRSAPTNGFPFVLWLISGLVPWFMFSDGITAITNCLLEYSYLVKKVVFNIKMLPIVKIISALFVHIFFIVFTFFVFLLNGYSFSLYYFQIVYYLFAMVILIWALGQITCAVVVFFRDLGQIVQIALQIGIWMTPIMWNLTMVGPELQKIFKLIPTFYIVEGYRDSFINQVWFWEKPELTVYYWTITLALFFIGTKVFQRLKIHFADVL